MPYFLIRIDSPAVPVNRVKTGVKMGFGTDKIQSVSLEQYQATGLGSSLPMKIEISGQCQEPMYGNVTTSEFPLFWHSLAIPNGREDLKHPIQIAGHGFMNGAAQLEFQVSSIDPTQNVVFTTLWLLFRVNYLCAEEPLYPLPLRNLEWEMLQR